MSGFFAVQRLVPLHDLYDTVAAGPGKVAVVGREHARPAFEVFVGRRLDWFRLWLVFGALLWFLILIWFVYVVCVGYVVVGGLGQFAMADYVCLRSVCWFVEVHTFRFRRFLYKSI